MEIPQTNELGKHLTEWRRQLVMEQGTEPPCPWCGVPRVKRSDYIRCNPCGTNWIDSERNLTDSKGSLYLETNPQAARDHARMVATASKPAEKSAAAAS